MKQVDFVSDSSFFAYNGLAADMKEVLNQLNTRFSDSASGTWGMLYSNNYAPVLRNDNVTDNVMPDLRNMTIKDALFLLENHNMKVRVQGKGKVIAQDILPGTAVLKNQTVKLLLN